MKSRGALRLLGLYFLFLIPPFCAGLWLYSHSFPFGLSYSSSLESIRAAYGGGADPGVYVEAAAHFLKTGQWKLDYMVRWPPGFPLVILAVLTLFPANQFVLGIFLASVALWALALLALAELLSQRWGWKAHLFVHSIWLLPSIGVWTLGEGILYSESISTALFITWLALFGMLIQQSPFSKRIAVLAGVSLAAASLCRPYYFLTGLFTLLILVFSLFFRKKFLPGTGQHWAENTRKLFVFGMVFLGIVLTWKVRNQFVIGNGSLARSHGFIWNNLWTPTTELPSFLIAGNTACVSDPLLCQILHPTPQSGPPPSLARRLALMTWITFPARWMTHRLKNFSHLWINTPTWKIHDRISAWNVIQGVLFLLLGTLGLIVSLRWTFSNSSAKNLAAGVYLAFILQNLAIYTFAHFEFRYSLPMHLFCFFVPWWLFAVGESRTEA